MFAPPYIPNALLIPEKKYLASISHRKSLIKIKETLWNWRSEHYSFSEELDLSLQEALDENISTKQKIDELADSEERWVLNSAYLEDDTGT